MTAHAREKLESVTIRGYKSICGLDEFPLRDLSMIVGANGAGKSNLLPFFRLLRSFMGGGVKDEETTLELFHKAAEEGHPETKKLMGV